MVEEQAKTIWASKDQRPKSEMCESEVYGDTAKTSRMYLGKDKIVKTRGKLAETMSKNTKAFWS